MDIKRILMTAAAALIAGAAYAQTTTTTTTTVQPEVWTKVRQYVTARMPRAVTAPSGFNVTVGATLPEAVEVESFPTDVGVTQYRYVVIGGRNALVHPGSRRIVEIIE